MLYAVIILAIALFVTITGLRLYATSKVAGRLATSIGRFREVAMTPSRRAPVALDHAVLAEHRAAYDAFAADVSATGGKVLGDWEEFYPDGRSAGVTRWFVDGSGQIAGWFGVVPHTSGPAPVFYCVSELDSGTFVTTLRGRSNRRLASPPLLQGAHCDETIPITAALEQHRARLTNTPGRAVSVTTGEEAQAMLDRMRNQTMNWRQGQDPAELLDLDLKSVLGDHYQRLGSSVARKLRQQA